MRRFGEPALIGMVHLLPLPRSPGWRGSMQEVIDRAAADADVLFDGGMNGVIVENFGDRPFAKLAGTEAVAAMSTVIASIPKLRGRTFGVNALRNDPEAALAIAVATGAAFIRVNVHAGAMLTDQGMIEGRAADTLRRRRALESDVSIFADFRVKHATPLVETDLIAEARDLRRRVLADAILVTGRGTGEEADLETLAAVRDAVGDTPLIVASGVTPDRVQGCLAVADGVIVGSSLERDGKAGEPVDPRRVAELVSAAARRTRG